MSKMKRILNDIKNAKSLENCGIFITFDEEKATEVHAIVEGPEDTPYTSGFFHFRLIFPSEYPLSPPHVTLLTTGNGRVRYNPNLYSCGKVCLSILGTWSGPGWTPGLTLSSVLLSIQTLLCPQPMLNEPGYENHKNKTELSTYNSIIQHETLRLALVSNVKAIMNGTSGIPSDLHEHIMTRYVKHLPYVRATCQKMAYLDGKSMNDPFGESRGIFTFKEVLKQFNQLVPEDQRGSVEKDIIDLSADQEGDDRMEVVEVMEEDIDEKEEEEEEAIPEELQCGVCFDILATPAVLECGHVFCYLCALRWLQRKAICPTCREPQSEVTKLRRIFTLDVMCEREAKARNKSVTKAKDVKGEGEALKEDSDDTDDKVFESTYAMWSSRRDEGIALDNGKRLEARQKGAGRRGVYGLHMGGGFDYSDGDEDEYYNEFDDDEGCPELSYMPQGHGLHGASYFDHVGGSGNRLGSSDDTSTQGTSSGFGALASTTSGFSPSNEAIFSFGTGHSFEPPVVMDDETSAEKRERGIEARLKRFAAPSASASSQSAPAPSKLMKSPITPKTSPSLSSLPLEDQEREREKMARAAELERLKKDKIAKAKERKRLQMEIEHDRRERKKNCGVLPGSHDSLFSKSVDAKALVVEASGKSGCVPNSCNGERKGMLTDVTSSDVISVTPNADSLPPTPPSEERVLAASRKVDTLLDLICKPFEQALSRASSSLGVSCPASITTAAEVDTALQLLLKIVGNIIDNPQVEKYRSINTSGKMFKEKLARVLGVQRLLHALGFQQVKAGQEGGESASTASSLKMRVDSLTGELASEDLCILIDTRDKMLSIVQCRKM